MKCRRIGDSNDSTDLQPRNGRNWPNCELISPEILAQGSSAMRSIAEPLCNERWGGQEQEKEHWVVTYGHKDNHDVSRSGSTYLIDINSGSQVVIVEC